MKRRDHSGAVADLFSYSYTSGTNRLAQVMDAGVAQAGGLDEGTSLFQYDASGNVTHQHIYGANWEPERAWAYDERNIPVALSLNSEEGPIELAWVYRYGLDGEPYWKEPVGGAGEFTLNDGGATLEAFAAAETRL